MKFTIRSSVQIAVVKQNKCTK